MYYVTTAHIASDSILYMWDGNISRSNAFKFHDKIALYRKEHFLISTNSQYSSDAPRNLILLQTLI